MSFIKMPDMASSGLVGESSYSKTEECKEKIKESNMEKYNVEYTSQLKDFY